MFPCKDCERREIGCHGKCEEYQKARDEADKMIQVRREDHERWAYHNSVVAQNINKTVKRRLRQ